MEIADDARMAIAVGPEDVVTAIREDVDAMEKVILAQGAIAAAEGEHPDPVVKGEVNLAEADLAIAAVEGEHPDPVVKGEVNLAEAEVVTVAAEAEQPAPIEIQAALVVPEDSRGDRRNYLPLLSLILRTAALIRQI